MPSDLLKIGRFINNQEYVPDIWNIGNKYLREFGFLVNKRHDVELFDGDHVQSVLIVNELDVLPVDVLRIVLLLLQLEDVLHEKLLQVFIRVVYAELLETAIRGHWC